jgi:membrane-associated phospholipid phosphatase
VAAARVIQDVHWTSDVVGAALLGTGIGWIVTAGHEDGRAPRLAPSFDPPGLSLVVTFAR